MTARDDGNDDAILHYRVPDNFTTTQMTTSASGQDYWSFKTTNTEWTGNDGVVNEGRQVVTMSGDMVKNNASISFYNLFPLTSLRSLFTIAFTTRLLVHHRRLLPTAAQ